MAPDENWSSGYNPTNTTGFSALPAGMSVGNGWMTGDAYFWSSTCDDTQTFPASYLYLAMYSGIDTHYKYAGMSIRCIEDEDVPEPEPEPEPTETVKDYDGNEYPVVKIGDFYWMASNLKTQHLNDGTPIPVIEGGCSAWDGQTEPAACIFMNKSENEEKYGLLYNFYTVATGKLCPEGWTVPDWEQTDALPYGSIAQNVALMAPDDNWTALASDPTNTTGFSALPGGNSSWAFWERGSAYFWTSYTSDSGPASFTLGGTTMISQSYYESAGLSVRCIKKAEPEPEPEPAATVKDIDGNEYPVVEIGGLTPKFLSARDRRHRGIPLRLLLPATSWTRPRTEPLTVCSIISTPSTQAKSAPKDGRYPTGTRCSRCSTPYPKRQILWRPTAGGTTTILPTLPDSAPCPAASNPIIIG